MGEAKAPRTVDAAERAQLIRVAVYFGPPCLIMVNALAFFLHEKGMISGGAQAVLAVLSVPIAIAGVVAIHVGTSRSAAGFAHVVSGAGNIPPPPSYPRQEVLITRGQYAEAAEYFRDHIRIAPEDLEARLRLADLVERHLGGYEEAERLYLEVRQLTQDAREQFRAHNGLIDLYTKTGRTDRLKVELARFADRYRRSPQGEEAARRLRDLKAEDTTSAPPRSPR
ncbi:MAG: hypothetical protein DMD37_02685 [Gemmatimonadetes bacterium]|nr:MAG: hypothetical protein DMD68_11675 [Gemmatimonadota bacterium]PYP64399.1 MAG: hypothetical protein DMD37_02685 [Gemmatimonadota bacterium]